MDDGWRCVGDEKKSSAVVTVVKDALLEKFLAVERLPCRSRIKFRMPELDFPPDDAGDEQLLEYRLVCARANVLPYSAAMIALSSEKSGSSYGRIEVEEFDGALFAPNAMDDPGELVDLFSKIRPNYVIAETRGLAAFRLFREHFVPAFVMHGFVFWSADLYSVQRDGRRRVTSHEYIGDPAL